MECDPTNLRVAIRKFLDALDRRWDGESDRKRSNAISPLMEEAIADLRKMVEDV